MDREHSARKFEIIRGRRDRRPIDPTPFFESPPGAQTTLFPDAKPGVVLFVSFPEVGESEFVDVIQLLKPSHVFDLRLTPRFDVGQLNRQRAFALFAAEHARYVDLAIAQTGGLSRNDVWERARTLLRSGTLDLKRPVVFLLGHAASSIATDTEILTLLSETGVYPLTVHRVPQIA
jgi:hypothetical protein